MSDCLFCKIVEGIIPSYRLYEDDICIAFLDISQATLGHTLVVSKKHYSNLLEVNPIDLSHMSKVVQKLACSLYKSLDKVLGFNILNNCNEISGQSIMHFHIHIIPRYNKEELIIKATKENKLDETRFIQLLEKIKKDL